MIGSITRALSVGAPARHGRSVRDEFRSIFMSPDIAQPDALERRSQALANYEAAVRRGDTRDQHSAWEALRTATTQSLALSLGQQQFKKYGGSK